MINYIKKHGTLTICMLSLAVYGVMILIINFSGNPVFYDADMYTDMLYATKVCEQKTIFPRGWVFGNQLYAVATPVLAALFYGLTGNACTAMAIASTLMGAGVLLSFYWMLMPVLRSREEKWIAITAFLSLVLLAGDPYSKVNGWQLLFTMCSYYACYAICAFLAFGCRLRSAHPLSPGTVGCLVLACVMAFGTGIQSLRQTAIMICPLIGLEILRILFLWIRRQKVSGRTLLITGLLTAANLAGVLYAKFADVEQVEIFGTIELLSPSLWPAELFPALFNAASLLAGEQPLLTILIAVLGLPGIYLLLRSMFSNNHQKEALCLGLFCISLAVILVIDICTKMEIRPIYSFLVYPMLAFIAAYLFGRSRKALRNLIPVLLLIAFGFNCTEMLPVAESAGKDTVYEEVAACLDAHQITTIYSRWGLGSKIAIASDHSLDVGFWAVVDPFIIPISYLCTTEVFHANPSNCVYAIRSEEVSLVLQEADRFGLTLTLLQYFPESDICLYTSDVNFMELLYINNPWSPPEG